MTTAHHILEIVLRAWNDLEIFESLTVPTLALIDGNGGMDKNIIYAVLHEAIYCQGWVKVPLNFCSLF
jgi:proline iminopeptidase